ncbi:MAG: FecR domain-containing protein [Saprospiraceae bacterium]
MNTMNEETERLLTDDDFVSRLPDGKTGGGVESEEAAALGRLLGKHPSLPPDTDAAWQQFENKMTAQQAIRISLWRKLVATAAAVALVVGGFWWWQQPTNLFETSFGEMQRITLPDGSEVVLRANSSLGWEGTWAANGVREVWLHGEAFFQVTPSTMHSGKKFNVKTDALEVVVKGTSFNVSNRNNTISVALESGSVDVLHDDAVKTTLQPNQVFTWHKASAKGQKQEDVNLKKHTEWRSGVWYFDQTTLRDVAAELENNFGVSAHFADASLPDRQLSGSAPATSINVLLRSICTTLNIEATQEDNLVVFDVTEND